MDEELRVLYLLGRENFQKNDYTEAEKHLTAFIETVQDFADVWNMLGVIYHDQGKFQKAVESFERALKINPLYTEAQLSLAVTYNDLGQYHKARELYAGAKQQGTKTEGERIPDPFVKGKLANMHADLGDVYRGIGLFDEAVQEYRKALELRPEFPDIRTKMAKALHSQGRKEQALDELMEIKRNKPEYLVARINLGVMLYSEGRVADALREWREILKEDPENKKAQMYLRLVEKQQKED